MKELKLLQFQPGLKCTYIIIAYCNALALANALGCVIFIYLTLASNLTVLGRLVFQSFEC